MPRRAYFEIRLRISQEPFDAEAPSFPKNHKARTKFIDYYKRKQ